MSQKSNPHRTIDNTECKKHHMPKNLVIVESPAKAKTIEGYLGKDFLVQSSFGHVRDLPKGDKAVDIQHGFKPVYEVSSDKKEVVSKLKKLAKEAETVWLATDDDREGESISWHLSEALDLTDQKTRRIVFREITKQAILGAIQTPRGIDMDLVNAQQARRILDRLVGFELSPVLWKKIRTGLSAGRVQSVAVRMVVERERDIERFHSASFYKVVALFVTDNGKGFRAELNEKFEKEETAHAFLENCKSAVFVVEGTEVKPLKRSPAPPFTTSTLQQEASRKLGYSVSKTMTLAQKLYESGKISYMRTDSVNLSDYALQSAKEQIGHAYGKEFVQTRKYKTKSASAQEAHEAIRPTDFSVLSTGGDSGEQRLYELIWKRAIASQMSNARIEKTVITIGVSGAEEKFIATGEVIQFEGFLKVYLESSDEESDEEGTAVLPSVTKGQNLKVEEITATQRFSRPPARFTEAALVKNLEEMGIGRPSTYAPTISTIQQRGYVIKESRDGKERPFKEYILKNETLKSSVKKEISGAEKNKLFPTDMGMIVNDFLVKHFPRVTDYGFTALVEKEFDEIASGRKIWQTMLEDFYKKFHPDVEKTETIDRSEINTARVLGNDPKTGLKVTTRLGRYGPVVQLGDTENDQKPQYASLKKGQFIETITLEEALELFKLPREVGMFEDTSMTVAVGRFGPYIKHDNKFYSLGKDDDPLEISEERAIELILTKRKADSNKIIKQFEQNSEVKILNGRWGPYIVVGKKNVKIPKGKDPAELSLEECLALAEKAPEKKKRAFVGKKKT